MSGYIASVHGIFFVLIPSGIILYQMSANPKGFILSFVFFIVFTPLVAVMLMKVMYSSSNKLITTQALDTIESLFSKPTATEEEILKALHLAQCDDILAKLPDGIRTVIGTKGVYLSGGEMQRIALTRSILKDAPIVLLDEATAFADPENEYKIQKALDVLVQGKTVLMIAHRLSTITGADQILVLEKCLKIHFH